jgi:integrase
MGRNRRNSLPQMRLHEKTGHARVRMGGKTFWLGRYGSPEAQTTFDRLLVEYLANGRQAPRPIDRKGQPVPVISPSPDLVEPAAPPVQQPIASPAAASPAELTVSEVCVMFMEHARDFYRMADGSVSSSYHGYLQAVNALRPFGKLPASAFGPRCLRQIMATLVDGPTRSGKPRPRRSINKLILRIRALFKWAGSMELVPASTWHGLLTVEPLRKGRTTAPELPPVREVADDVVAATLPHLPDVVAHLVQFIRLAGCRPGEACRIRPCDIERQGKTWRWTLADHKNAWRDHDRVIMLGPRAQALITPYLERLRTTPDKYCFSPQASEHDRNKGRRQERKSPMTPSQAARKPSKTRQRPPRDHYGDDTLNRCIRRACEKAGIPRWTPLQLRHAAGTEARKAGGGLDAAQARLGHKHAKVTEVYAEIRLEKAAELAHQLG